MSIGRTLIVAARFAALTLAPGALMFAPTAHAQTMGEYGLATGHAAGSAGAVPGIGSSAGIRADPQSGSGPTRTVEIRTGDSTSPDDQGRDADSSKDTSDDKSDGDWKQVR